MGVSLHNHLPGYSHNTHNRSWGSKSNASGFTWCCFAAWCCDRHTIKIGNSADDPIESTRLLPRPGLITWRSRLHIRCRAFGCTVSRRRFRSANRVVHSLLLFPRADFPSRGVCILHNKGISPLLGDLPTGVSRCVCSRALLQPALKSTRSLHPCRV